MSNVEFWGYQAPWREAEVEVDPSTCDQDKERLGESQDRRSKLGVTNEGMSPDMDNNRLEVADGHLIGEGDQHGEETEKTVNKTKNLEKVWWTTLSSAIGH